MMTPREDRVAPPHFNPVDRDFHQNPYPIYRRYRIQDPVHWAGPADHRGDGVWYLFRHADVTSALRSPGLVRDRRILPSDPLGGILEKWMLFRNPPDHTRLRALVSKAFTRQMAERLLPAIQETASFLLDQVQGTGEMDLMLHYASPLPLIVIAELLGIPRSDRKRLRAWTMELALGIDLAPTDAVLARAADAALELVEYLRVIVGQRRAVPREDLISALIFAEEAADALTEDELLDMCLLLLGAGHETTINLIGNGTLALLRQPDAWAQLKADPECTDAAVEELLRFDCPVQMTFRVAREDADIGGRTVRAGEIVCGLLGSANRDPEAFPDPDRLDFTRAGAKHAAFSAGVHFCLGSHLARLEGQVAFRTLVNRLPRLGFSTTRTALRREGITLRGLKSLPLIF
jgi:pimeloyl-[acyl-carrier protein] synthase